MDVFILGSVMNIMLLRVLRVKLATLTCRPLPLTGRTYLRLCAQC